MPNKSKSLFDDRSDGHDAPLSHSDVSDSTREHWKQVELLLDGALDLPREERAQFLKDKCGNNELLLHEIEQRLLDCERAEQQEDFLTGSAVDFAKPILQTFVDDALNIEDIDDSDFSKLSSALAIALEGRYRIERVLGRGGMATVFLAHDIKHNRAVAIKVIDVATTTGGAQRFLREIHIAAQLNHPHILGVHDSGSSHGLLYYVMPYVDGETLRQKIVNNDKFPLADAIRIATELASAIEYAHNRGVVHRDLKPENILFSNEYAVIADFGIAKAIASAELVDSEGFQTQGNFAAGTPAYMSPERLTQSAASEQQADLYALGVIFYELLTGVRPFAGRTREELAQAHRDVQPKPISAFRNDCSPDIANLVMQLLSANAASRPANAELVLKHLKQPTKNRKTARTGLAVSGMVVVFVALIGALLSSGKSKSWLARPFQQRADDVNIPGIKQTIAVLPFDNLSDDEADEYFSDGITDELSHTLSQIPSLSLIGRTSSYAYKGKALAAQSIGRSLGATALVTGSVRRLGNRVRVVVQLINTASGTVLWDGAYERSSSDVLGVQNQITLAIAEALEPVLGVSAATTVGDNSGTTNQEAMDLFLKGRYFWLRRGANNISHSITYFKQAIERDPKFARAHAGLALAYGVSPAFIPDPADTTVALTMASAERALSLDSTSSDAHIALGMALESQLHFRRALDHYRHAVTLDPSSVFAHHILGLSLLNLGETDSALVQMQQASQLDPLAPSPAAGVAAALLSLRKFPEAIAAAHHAVQIDSSFSLSISTLASSFIFGGYPDSAVAILESGLKRLPSDSRLQAMLVMAYAATSRWKQAQATRDSLAQRQASLLEGTEPAFASMVFGNSKSIVNAFTNSTVLTRYISSGGWLGCNPLHDPLWSDPGFRRIMQSLSVRPCAVARPWPITRNAFSAKFSGQTNQTNQQ